MDPKKNILKQTLKWTLAGLPLGAVIGTAFFPLQSWLQQTLILVVLIWLQAFLLLSVFVRGN